MQLGGGDRREGCLCVKWRLIADDGEGQRGGAEVRQLRIRKIAY